MKFLLTLCGLLLVSCANVSTTRFTFIDGNKSVIVEMPKEIVAENLKVSINASSGVAEIEATYLTSENTGTIRAQAVREGQVVGKAAEGAAKGAVKGAIPVP